MFEFNSIYHFSVTTSAMETGLTLLVDHDNNDGGSREIMADWLNPIGSVFLAD